MRRGRIFGASLLLLWLAQPSCAKADNRLAIIIDDIGYNRAMSERAAYLPGSITLSVLPFTPYGNEIAKIAHSQGKELMLHLPMSNLKGMPLGKGGLDGAMSRSAFAATVQADLASLPFIRGVNNHMGSRLTQSAEAMQWLMDSLKNQNLYFVDSRTSAETVALTTAQANWIPSTKRDVFLDDLEEPKAIQFQLQRALSLAKERGSAVAIGHPYPATLSALADIGVQLEKANVRLVFVSELVQITSAAAPKPALPLDYCPAPPRFMWEGSHADVDLYDIPDIMSELIFGY